MDARTYKATIYSDGQLTIDVTTQPDPACLALLKRAKYGTRGVRYQQTGQEEKLCALRKPLFFQLYQQAELMGMYCLDERSLTMPTDTLTGYYGRYLAVDERSLGKGYGHLLKQQALRYVSSITDEQHVFYSYIEAKNTRSFRISEQEGFWSAGTLSTYIFRRYAPKSDPRFAVLSKTELAGLKERLTAYYENHTFKTFDAIGYQGNYFVLKEQGEIVAGIQANPVRWRFLHMPGLVGWITMHIVPRFAATRRFFDPDNYAFVALEGVYLKEQRPELLFALLESVLVHFGLHSALWLIDDRDSINQLLHQPKAGWLSGFQKNVTTHVLVKERNVPAEVLRTNQPLYVSSFDYA